MRAREIHQLTRKERNRRCAELFVRQYGVISRSQALEAGITDSCIWTRLKGGTWEVLLPGVYRLVGVVGSWWQDLKAAELWAKGAAVSHRAAAAHWGLEGHPRGIIELTVPAKTTTPNRRVVMHVSKKFAAIDIVNHRGIATTTVPRTLIDLGAVQRRWRVQTALDHALRSGMTSSAQLWSALDRLAGRGFRGAAVLRSLLQETERERSPSDSPLERRIGALMKRTAGIPAPTPQYLLFDDAGIIGRLDFAWPHIRLGLEVDGYDPHMSRAAFYADRNKMNRASAIGWTILRATGEDAHRPSVLLHTIESFFP